MEDKLNQERFQILSLDGGGIKGLFSAAVLAALEDDLNMKVVDCFDLIAGTSTGGIIALGLGLGLRPREIVEFYVDEGPKIFGGRFSCFRKFKHPFIPKHSQSALKDALQRRFGDAVLGQSGKRLLIPAFSLAEDDVYIFRTAHHERLKRDYKVPAWKIALATSSAPTYFRVCREIDHIRMVDGGVWANNPILVSVVEAFNTLNVPLEKISVCSIGTSEVMPKRKWWLDRGGLLPWGLSGAAVDVLMRGQSLGALNQASFLLGSNNVQRLNPLVACGEFDLDSITKADDLIAKASHFSRKFAPIFEENFSKHLSQKFCPIYKHIDTSRE